MRLIDLYLVYSESNIYIIYKPVNTSEAHDMYKELFATKCAYAVLIGVGPGVVSEKTQMWAGM